MAEKPSIIGVGTGQIGREFLTKYLPGVVITDTAFPMNGEKTVEWFLSHNLSSYPLIGFSSTSVERLSERVRNYFITGNARYFNKLDVAVDRSEDEIIKQIILIEDLKRKTI